MFTINNNNKIILISMFIILHKIIDEVITKKKNIIQGINLIFIRRHCRRLKNIDVKDITKFLKKININSFRF